MLALLAGWSTTALGAAELLSRCNGNVHNLDSLEVTENSLSINRIDHVSDEDDPAKLDSGDIQADLENTAAPYLYLTPRVANLLRDVFRSDRETTLQPAVEGPSSSPLADSVETNQTPSQPEDATPSTVGVEQEVLPTFQQQMYRKDI
jgi:hypothetical protein